VTEGTNLSGFFGQSLSYLLSYWIRICFSQGGLPVLWRICVPLKGCFKMNIANCWHSFLKLTFVEWKNKVVYYVGHVYLIYMNTCAWEMQSFLRASRHILKTMHMLKLRTHKSIMKFWYIDFRSMRVDVASFGSSASNSKTLYGMANRSLWDEELMKDVRLTSCECCCLYGSESWKLVLFMPCLTREMLASNPLFPHTNYWINSCRFHSPIYCVQLWFSGTCMNSTQQWKIC